MPVTPPSASAACEKSSQAGSLSVRDGLREAMRDDIERVLIDEEVIEKRLDRMAGDIGRDFPGGTLVASYHGGTESTGRVNFLDRHFPEVRGRHVLLLDDILDTGRTLRAVSVRLMEEGAVAVHTAVLLAKDKPRAAEVQADYVGFTIGDEFVVGYGLDYMGKYRNLPYIGVLKPGVI
jgi:hypoxanthine phosphoribosyltransferase